jgi:hypothetical protein
MQRPSRLGLLSFVAFAVLLAACAQILGGPFESSDDPFLHEPDSAVDGACAPSICTSDLECQKVCEAPGHFRCCNQFGGVGTCETSQTACGSALDAGTVTDVAGTDSGVTKISCNKPLLYECDTVVGSLSAASMEQANCPGQGGSVVPACSAENVLGCCTFVEAGTTTEYCYYTGNPSPIGEAACAADGGLFSLTP